MQIAQAVFQAAAGARGASKLTLDIFKIPFKWSWAKAAASGKGKGNDKGKGRGRDDEPGAPTAEQENQWAVARWFRGVGRRVKVLTQGEAESARAMTAEERLRQGQATQQPGAFGGQGRN